MPQYPHPGVFYRPDAAPLRHLKDEPLEKYPLMQRILPWAAGLHVREVTSLDEYRYGIPQYTQKFISQGFVSGRDRYAGAYDSLAHIKDYLGSEIGKSIKHVFFNAGAPKIIGGNGGERQSFTPGLPFYLERQLGLVWPHDFVLLAWRNRLVRIDTWEQYDSDGLNVRFLADIGLGIR